MKEPNAITELRLAYKFILILLMVNNIAGIALNPHIFLFSILFVIGIPGGCLALHYTVAAMRKKPLLDTIIPPISIIYNIFIYWLLTDKLVQEKIIGGIIWPTLNITLSALAFTIAIAGHYKSKLLIKSNPLHHLNN